MRSFLTLLIAIAVATISFGVAITAQNSPGVPAATGASNTDAVYVCPMLSDRDIRSHTPGSCPRCGMKLVAEVPDPVEYHMDLTVTPPLPAPGKPASIAFAIH